MLKESKKLSRFLLIALMCSVLGILGMHTVFANSSDDVQPEQLGAVEDEMPFIFDENTQTITGYQGSAIDDGNLVIPAQITVGDTTYDVKHIGDSAFSADSLGFTLTNVSIPEGIETIGNSAFKGNKISQYNIPVSVTTIGDYAFALNLTKSETRFVVPASSNLSTIGSHAFEACNLGLVDLSNMTSNATIKDSAFENNNISNLTFGNNTFAKIGERAFASNNLSQIDTLNANTLGKGAFYDNGRYVVLGTTNVDNDVEMGHFGSVTKPTSVYVRGVLQDNTDTVVLSTIKLSFNPSEELPYDQLLLEDKGNRTTVKAPYLSDYKATLKAWYVNLSTTNEGSDKDNPIDFTYEASNKGVTITGLSALELNVNDVCDKAKLLDGIKAISADGVDITASIKLTPESVDTSYAHTKNVVYEVEDAFGNTCRKTRLVNIAINPDKIETGNGWLMEDFEFNGNTVGSLTRYGREKLKTNHKLVYPTINPYTGEAIKNIDTTGLAATYDVKLLKEVVIPEGPEKINDDAFVGHYSIVKVSLPSTMKNIGRWSFENCNELKYINFPEALEVIGTRAFEGCKLEHVKLANNVRRVESSAFKENNIKTLVLNDGIEYLGSSAFKENQITSIDIPRSIKTFGTGVFSHNKIKSVVWPEEYEEIPAHTFESNKELTDVRLPKSLKKIGDYAFYLCSINRDVLEFSENVYYLGDYAFASVSYRDLVSQSGDERRITDNTFKKIILPSSLEHLGYATFAGSLVEEIEFRNTQLTEINSFAFWGHCINHIEVPEGITKISYGAFSEARFTTHKEGVPVVFPTLPDSIEEVDHYAFKVVKTTKPKLVDVKMPPHLKTIGVSAFSNWGAETLELNEGLEIISKKAFACLEGQGKVYGKLVVPSSVNEIGTGAFKNNNIEALECKGPLKIYGEAFRRNELTSLRLVEGTDFTWEYNGAAFEGNNLKEVVIPDSVTNIPEYTFEHNKLTNVQFGENSKLEKIGSRAFSSNELVKVNLYGSLKKIAGNAFSYNKGYTPFPSVPAGGDWYDGNKVSLILKDLDGDYINPYNIESGEEDTWYLNKCLLKINKILEGTKTPIGEPIYRLIPIEGEEEIDLGSTSYYVPVKENFRVAGDGKRSKEVFAEYRSNPLNNPDALTIELHHSNKQGEALDKVLQVEGLSGTTSQYSDIRIDVSYSGDEQVIKEPWVVVDFNTPTPYGHMWRCKYNPKQGNPYVSESFFEKGRMYLKLRNDLKRGDKLQLSATISWPKHSLASKIPDGSIVDLTGKAYVCDKDMNIIKSSKENIGFWLRNYDFSVGKLVFPGEKGRTLYVDDYEIDGMRVAKPDANVEVPYKVYSRSLRQPEKVTFTDKPGKYWAYRNGEKVLVYPELVAEKSPGWEWNADKTGLVYKDCKNVSKNRDRYYNTAPVLVLKYPDIIVDNKLNDFSHRKNDIYVYHGDVTNVIRDNVINGYDENGRERSRSEVENLFINGVLEEEVITGADNYTYINLASADENIDPEPPGNIDSAVYKRCWGEVGSHNDKMKNTLLHDKPTTEAYFGNQDVTYTFKYSDDHEYFDYHDFIYDSQISREKEYEWAITANTWGVHKYENYKIEDINLDDRMYYSAVYLPEGTVATLQVFGQDDCQGEAIFEEKLYEGRFNLPEDIAKQSKSMRFNIEATAEYTNDQKNYSVADIYSLGNIWSLQVYTKFKDPSVELFDNTFGFGQGNNRLSNSVKLSFDGTDYQGNVWHESSSWSEWVGILPVLGRTGFDKTVEGVNDNSVYQVLSESPISFEFKVDNLVQLEGESLNKFKVVDILPGFMRPISFEFNDEFIGAAKNPKYRFIENVDGEGHWGIEVVADSVDLDDSCRMGESPMFKGSINIAKLTCFTDVDIPNDEYTNHAWMGWDNNTIEAVGDTETKCPHNLMDECTQTIYDKALFKVLESKGYSAVHYIRPCDDTGAPIENVPWSTRGIYIHSQQPYEYRVSFSHLEGVNPPYFEAVEILPYNKDKRIVKNDDGVYVDRYTDMTGVTTDNENYSALPHMTGPIKWKGSEAETQFEYRYAIANPYESYEGKDVKDISKDVSWYTADEIDAMEGGFANVTAFKVVAKQETISEVFDNNLTVNFDVPMQAPLNKDLALDDKIAVSSFAYWTSDNMLTTPVEVNNVWIHMVSKRAQLKIQKYGKGFGDAAKEPLADAKFKLYRIVDARDQSAINLGELEVKEIGVGDTTYTVVAQPIAPSGTNLTELGKTDDSTEVVDSVTTNAYGVATYKNLRCDYNYVLEEFECPDGFAPEGGNTRYISGEDLFNNITDDSDETTLEVVNNKIPEMKPITPLGHTFTFYKVDKNGVGLGPVGFKLSATSATGYKHTQYAYSQFMTGLVQFRGVPAFYGDVEFTLEEVSPLGTMTPVDNIKIHFKKNVDSDGSWLLDSDITKDDDGNIVSINSFGRRDVQTSVVTTDDMELEKLNFILPLKVKNDKTNIVINKMGIYNVDEQKLPVADLNMNSGKLMSDVELEIRRGEEADSSLVATATTNAKGQIVFEQLNTDTDYFIHEPQAPEDFKPLDKPIKVHITSQGVLKINDVDTLNNYVVVPNIPEQNTNLLQLYKTDALGGKGNPVEGATFELCEVNGRHAEVIQTATTDANGIVEFKDFGLDEAKKPIQKKFVIREAKAPGGYLSGFKPIEFETSAGEYQVFNYTAMNKPIEVHIAKIRNSDNAPIKGVEFGIFEADGTTPVLDASGEQVKGVTNKEGKYSFTSSQCKLLDPTKIYKIKEIDVPEGYDTTRPCEFTLDLPGASNRETFDGKFYFTGINYFEFGRISVIKTDRDTRDKLAGAKFELYDLDSLEVALDETKLVDTQITGEDGTCLFDGLEPSKTYRLHEVEAPLGYNKAADVLVEVTAKKTYYVEVKDEAQVVTQDLHFQKFVNGESIGYVPDGSAEKKYFEFELYKCTENDAVGELIATTSSNDEGKVEFKAEDIKGALTYRMSDVDKTYTYWVKESTEKNYEYVVYDTKMVKVEITPKLVDDNLTLDTKYTVYVDGQPQTDVAVAGETQVAFNNRYDKPLPTTGASGRLVAQALGAFMIGVGAFYITKKTDLVNG